jgi:hypothetical protein
MTLLCASFKIRVTKSIVRTVRILHVIGFVAENVSVLSTAYYLTGIPTARRTVISNIVDALGFVRRFAWVVGQCG